jgi:hypothetical protein
MAHKKKHHESKSMSRRHHEMHDAGMITEDHSAIANMPQEVKMHAWPRAHEGMDSRLDDTIHGINRQMNRDESETHTHLKPHKY